MPVKKVRVKKMVEDKRVDPKFDASYREVEDAYKLNRREVEANKSKKTIPKNG